MDTVIKGTVLPATITGDSTGHGQGQARTTAGTPMRTGGPATYTTSPPGAIRSSTSRGLCTSRRGSIPTRGGGEPQSEVKGLT